MIAFASRLKTLLRPAACALALATMSATAGAQTQTQTLPPAGTAISNQATASYEFGDVTINLLSNRVQVTVAPVEGLRLTADQTREAPIGAPVALPHRLTNTGNVANFYTFNSANLGGDDYDLTDLRVYGDINGNGLADSGEPRLDEGAAPVALQPGESYDLLVTGFVPVTARPEQIGRVQLNAATRSGALTATNTDTIRVAQGVAVDVRKDASTRQSNRGQIVGYDLIANSRGSAAPAPLPITVDGAPRSFVVLRDAVPANTTLSSWTTQGQNLPLYHRTGDADNAYTTQPAGITDAVALGISDFAPGTTIRATMTVRINDNASGNFDNTAQIIYRDGAADARVTTPSNTVQVEVPIAPPTLTYYTNDSYSREATVTGMNRPLYLQGDSSACNGNSALAERVTLDLTSTLTGDTIRTEMIETGPNTGVFRVANPIPTGDGEAIAGDNTLQIRRDDVLVARLGGCGTADALARVLVDPLGIVYDARSNLPIAGARVTLLNVATNQPALVFDFDGVTPRPSTVVTGADGAFQFPQVAPGSYRLQIVPPATFTFPSKLAPANQPANRTINASGSYGGSFEVSAATGAVTLDVPLDPPAGAGLFIDKIARSRDAEIGGSVDYQVTIRNVAPVAVDNIQLNDNLPRGLTYVAGSARRQNAATTVGTPATLTTIADPTITAVRDLRFNVGTLAAGESAVITYRTLIGPGTKTGKVRNSARATGATAFDSYTSNTASADVTIRGGVFTTRGVLMGRVFVDLNGNGSFNKGELAVPGARIFLEDGTYAVTDRDGQWTIYGVLPLTHVVKIDRTTLPLGATLQPLTVNYAGRGDSVFADVKNSELQRINFALSNASDAVIADVQLRIAKGEPEAPELRAQVQNALTTTPSTTTAATRAQPATGVVGSGGVAIPGINSRNVIPGAPNVLPGASNDKRAVQNVPDAASNDERGASNDKRGVSNDKRGVSLATGGVSLATGGASLATDGVSLATDGVSLATDGVSLATDGVSLATDGVFPPNGQNVNAGQNATRTVTSKAPGGIDARPLRTAGDGPLDGQFSGPARAQRARRRAGNRTTFGDAATRFEHHRP